MANLQLASKLKSFQRSTQKPWIEVNNAARKPRKQPPVSNYAKKDKVTRIDTEDMPYDKEDTNEDDNQESDDSGASMGSSENDVSDEDEDRSEDDDDARAKRNIEIEGDLLPEEKEVGGPLPLARASESIPRVLNCCFLPDCS